MPITTLVDRQFTAPSAANAVAITPNATTWANSAYVTLLASTPSACILTGFTVFTADGASSVPTKDIEFDVATGAAGAEVVIATFRAYNRQVFTGQTSACNTFVLPIPIDNIGSGIRLSARMRQNDTATITYRVSLNYIRKPLTSTILTTAQPSKVIPAATVGITVTAGSPAWTSGSWVDLRTASGVALVIIGMVIGNASNNDDYEIELGTGASGSEVIIATYHFTLTGQGMPSFIMLPNPIDNVAASTRLAVRLRCATGGMNMVFSLMVMEKPL